MEINDRPGVSSVKEKGQRFIARIFTFKPLFSPSGVKFSECEPSQWDELL